MIEVDPFIIHWVRNYLTCRSQLVVVEGEKPCVLATCDLWCSPRISFWPPFVSNEVTNQSSLDSFMLGPEKKTNKQTEVVASRDGSAKKYTNKICRDNVSLCIPTLAFLDNLLISYTSDSVCKVSL